VLLISYILVFKSHVLLVFPAKKYAEISPSHNITFKSAAGVSHMPDDDDWESSRATEWSFSRLHSAYDRLSQQQ